MEKGSEILSVIKSLSQSIPDCNPLVYEMLRVMVIILGIQFLGTLGIGFKLFVEHSATDHETDRFLRLFDCKSENLGY